MRTWGPPHAATRQRPGRRPPLTKPGTWTSSMLALPDASAGGEVGQARRAAPPVDPWTRHNATRYASMVIRSFGNTMTERLWSRERTKKLDPRIERSALRKLVMVDAAETLDDLRVPPGNRLEALRGDRTGQHSIRINQQWRVCFTWTTAGPENVEIVDYH